MDQQKGDIYLPQVFLYLRKFQQIRLRADQDVSMNRVCQGWSLSYERNSIIEDNFS